MPLIGVPGLKRTSMAFTEELFAYVKSASTSKRSSLIASRTFFVPCAHFGIGPGTARG